MTSPITSVNSLPMPTLDTSKLIDDMKSIDMLEMSNHFKSVLDTKEKQLTKITQKHNELFKIVSACYGTMRMMDNFMDNIEFEDGIFCVMRGNIEFLRNECSKAIHAYLPEEGDDDVSEIIIPINLD